MLEVLGEAQQSLVNDDVINLSQAWSSNKVSGLFERLNILHNWDFRNPVNQRRQTSYNAPGQYCIDRWLTSSGTFNILVTPDGLQMQNIGMPWEFTIQQRIEFPSLLLGKQYTLSVMLGDGNVYSNTGIAPNTMIDATPVFVQFPGGYVSFRFIVSMNTSIVMLAVSPNQSITFRAVKLELGTVSTLLNDPPMGFGKELAICQRFYEKSENMSMFMNSITAPNRLPLTSRSLSGERFAVRKRATPTVSIFDSSGNVGNIWRVGGGTTDVGAVAVGISQTGFSGIDTSVDLNLAIRYTFSWTASADL